MFRNFLGFHSGRGGEEAVSAPLFQSFLKPKNFTISISNNFLGQSKHEIARVSVRNHSFWRSFVPGVNNINGGLGAWSSLITRSYIPWESGSAKSVRLARSEVTKWQRNNSEWQNFMRSSRPPLFLPLAVRSEEQERLLIRRPITRA